MYFQVEIPLEILDRLFPPEDNKDKMTLFDHLKANEDF